MVRTDPMQVGNLREDCGIRSGMLVAGRYTLAREIAQGGMGSVWGGGDVTTGSSVALKFQNAVWGETGNERRFAREVAALHSVSHDHVVKILDSGRDQGRCFIVMELLSGVTLGTRLRDGAPPTLEEARLVVTQTALGLSAAHAAGVLHRDIKPSNLFLAETEQGTCVKVLDFGIARSTVVEGDASASALVGSPAYMSPEQARGLAVDERTDLWSLAVVAFKMLTGVDPFSEGELPATLQRICEGRARPLHEFRPDLPPALQGFFKVAFSVDPARRLQTATELATAFARACEGVMQAELGRSDRTEPLAPHTGAPARRLSWGGAVLGTAAALSAAVGLSITGRLPVLEAVAASPPLVARVTDQPPETPRALAVAEGESALHEEPVLAVFGSTVPPLATSAPPAEVAAAKAMKRRAAARRVASASPETRTVAPSRTDLEPLETPVPASDDPLDRRF